MTNESHTEWGQILPERTRLAASEARSRAVPRGPTAPLSPRAARGALRRPSHTLEISCSINLECEGVCCSKVWSVALKGFILGKGES